MIASILLVLIVELLNSALEAALDHTSLEQHPLAKRAKEFASAAVLLSLVNALVLFVHDKSTSINPPRWIIEALCKPAYSTPAKKQGSLLCPRCTMCNGISFKRLTKEIFKYIL